MASCGRFRRSQHRRSRGAIYVAFSKKYDGVLRRESSPYELLAQKILAAGGKLPGLKQEYSATPNSLNNPICSSDNCLMVHPPSQPNKTVFLDLPGEPHWLAFDAKGTFLYVAAGQIPVLQIYDAARDHSLVRNLPVDGKITDLSLSQATVAACWSALWAPTTALWWWIPPPTCPAASCPHPERPTQPWRWGRGSLPAPEIPKAGKSTPWI